MKNILLTDVEDKVKTWQKNSKQWHFHYFIPNGIYNDIYKDKHVVILENQTDTLTYIVPSEKKETELLKKLTIMLYGEDCFIKEEKPSDGGDDKKINIFIKKAKELSEKGISWNYNLISPECMFSKSKEEWSLILESENKKREDEQEEEMIITYEKEPIADLKKTITLFMKQ